MKSTPVNQTYSGKPTSSLSPSAEAELKLYAPIIARELTMAQKFREVSPTTPCNKCVAYDFGSSLYGKTIPQERCKKLRMFLDVAQATVGCESFRPRKRFTNAPYRR